ncbi:MAG: CPBP family intramembrane glutamic endopeptidase [Terracidiphilus sp.]|jgi:membrane protease YdiL (CAAX protease family)
MTILPEDESPKPGIGPADDSANLAPSPARTGADEQHVELTRAEPDELASGAPILSAPDPVFMSDAPPSPSPIFDPQLFQSFFQPPVRPRTRIPHFGHLSLLIPIGGIGFACTGLILVLAMRLHLFGWSLSAQAAATNIQLILASEAILYLITFGISFVVFPLFWKEKFFTGLQWRAAVALHRFWPLAATALGCAGLAALDEVLMPGPSNSPIEKMMRAPGAAWLMFAFGTTLAPFFEEMFFRGFLLPALCTAWDWTAEQFSQRPAPPLDANGYPQWSFSAMAVGSIVTSLPFALLHVDQQGHALGPFLLLILVSLILCTVRLKTRSLAASTLVHACYNFIIFALALIGTGGFRHFDKM